jgi:hypothetical protein
MNKQYIWVVTHDFSDDSFGYLFSAYEKAVQWTYRQICEHMKENPEDFSSDDVDFFSRIENLDQTLSMWYEFARETYTIECVLVDEFDVQE